MVEDTDPGVCPIIGFQLQLHGGGKKITSWDKDTFGWGLQKEEDMVWEKERTLYTDYRRLAWWRCRRRRVDTNVITLHVIQ